MARVSPIIAKLFEGHIVTDDSIAMCTFWTYFARMGFEY